MAADALIDEGYELYRRSRSWAANTFRAGFKTANWIDADRVDDVVALAPLLTDRPYGPCFGECVLFAFTELGEDERDRVVAEGRFPPLLDTWLLPGVLGAAAHSRAKLGDAPAAAALREELAGMRGRLCVTGIGAAFGDVDLATSAVTTRPRGPRSTPRSPP